VEVIGVGREIPLGKERRLTKPKGNGGAATGGQGKTRQQGGKEDKTTQR